ncbi:lantibiotic dehydratase C-terminal domain-containing protein [Herbidospora cretacea]|uniref:lantibiotic dehydratase C-terminal domain-containing protein n=1 Tax=Herbidospora cretacea TaxID=28444 RepID=UPI000773F0AA|nr:lantibiotic dehydratase C-terminal domain-containing protein [Herbidospora cretacea]
MTGWESAHLFHTGDLDDLIRDVVTPLARSATACFYLRYWESGPHVRLRLKGVPRDEVRARAARWFAGHPSPAVDAPAYRRLAAVLAKGERRERYDPALHAPGSVVFLPYEPEENVYGDMPAAERHFGVSSALALDVLHGAPAMDRRTAVGLAVLTLTMAACQPDLAEAARRLPPSEPGDLPPGLVTQTERLWRLKDGPGLLGAWAASIHDLAARLPATTGDAGSAHAHLAVIGDDARRARVLLRCAHLFHNRIGLRPGPESHVSTLAARALAALRR